MSTAPFDLQEYRRERLQWLERRCDFLEGERRRLEWLLGYALEVAVTQTATTPMALLEVLCELMPTAPSRARYLEERERSRNELRLERVVEVLRETAR